MRKLRTSELEQVHGGLVRQSAASLGGSMQPLSQNQYEQKNGPLMSDWGLLTAGEYGTSASESTGSSTTFYTGAIPGTDITVKGSVQQSTLQLQATDSSTGITATNDYNIATEQDSFTMGLNETSGNWTFAFGFTWHNIGMVKAFDSFNATASYRL